jgi:hypothetical protein
MVSSAADGASRDPRSHRFVPSAAHAIVVRKRLENEDGNLTVCQEGLEAFGKLLLPAVGRVRAGCQRTNIKKDEGWFSS